MDLSSLSQEEIKMLKEALSQYDQTAPTEAHADIEEDREFLEPIVAALEMLAKANEEMGERLQCLEKIVMEDMIGSIKEVYDGHEKQLKIDGLKGKYGEMFDPIAPAWKQLNEGEGDIYEKLFDVVQELKGSEGYSEESEDENIKSFAQQLKDKVSAIKGIEMEKPEAIVEIEAKGSPDKLASMLENIKKQKERSKGASIF